MRSTVQQAIFGAGRSVVALSWLLIALGGCGSSGGDDGREEAGSVSAVVSAAAPAAAANAPQIGATTSTSPFFALEAPDSPLMSALPGAAVADQAALATLRFCGNEGEEACGLLERDIPWNATCDAGLQAQVEVCGCVLRGLRGNCLIPTFCRKCRNDTRHRSSTTHEFASSWISWALTNQRDQLAVDEPLNWAMRFATHNAFNNVSGGHTPRVVLNAFGAIAQIVDAPNHFYSMSDQLDLGSRALAIDAHWARDNARLCHSAAIADHPSVEALICQVPDVLGGDGVFPSMRYLADGIKEIRNWVKSHPQDVLVLDLENYVGCTTCAFGDGAYVTDPIEEYLGQWLLFDTLQADQPFPSRAEMLAMGKRVIFVTSGSTGENYDFAERDIISGVFPVWTRNNQDFEGCKDTIDGGTNHGGPALTAPGLFTLVVEDRTLQAGFLELAGGAFGEITADDVRRIAKCNYSLIFTDFLGSDLSGAGLGRRFDVPDFSRHEAAIWSWRTGDRGGSGDCALHGAASGRWASADCATPHHYVCAPPRSESGTADRSMWRQREDRWRITTASGPWSGGPAACAAEFPFDAVENTAYVFSVPVNGYQNDRLKAANVAGQDLWLNYTDQVKEGRWLIPRRADINTPPVADAGPDQELECGVDATLDGSASFDADGDPLTYLWSGPFGTLPGSVVNVRLGAGEHTVNLTVQDGKGGVGTDSALITVRDTLPPSLSVALSPQSLWSPNHAMIQVTADVHATDQCDLEDVVIELVSVVSDEADNATGDGNTELDIQGAEVGSGDLEFALRAERSGKNSGRTYTATYRATDHAGNSTEKSATVSVPHDRSP